MVTFLTEEARRSHPQARRVNAFLMKSYFNKQLTEREIDLLRNSVGLNDFTDFLSSASPKEQLKGLMCFFLGKAKGIDSIAGRIMESVLPDVIARAALLTGRFELIKGLDLSQERLLSILDWKDCAESLLSMEEGTSFIEYLELDISPDLKVKDIFISTEYQKFYHMAAQNGHLSVLEHLEASLSLEEQKAVIKADNLGAYQGIAKNGYLPVLEHVEARLTFDEKKAVIEANNYSAYRWAAENGHLFILNHHEASLSLKEKRKAIKARDFYAYRWAAQKGHLPILRHLESSLMFDEKKEAIKAGYFEAYRLAAQNGHLPILRHLESSLSLEEKNTAIKAYNFEAYRLPALKGHLPVLEHLEASLTFDEKKEAIKARDFYAYRWAAQKGHLPILRHLESSLSLEEKKEAIKAGNFEAYRLAAQNGHLPILRHLESSLSLEEKKEAIKAGNFEAYLLASQNGHLPIIKHLEASLTPEEKKEAIKANDFFAYRYASNNGDLPLLKHLGSSLTFDEKKSAIKADDFFAYRLAAQNGHLSVLQHLEVGLSLEEKKAAIKADDYRAYQWVAEKGVLPVLRHLEASLTCDEKKAAIKTAQFYAYQWAAINGHLSVLKHLEESLSAQEKKAVIIETNYEAYYLAALNWHLPVLKHLEENLSLEEKKSAMRAVNFKAYQSAAQYGHLSVLEHLEANLSLEEKIIAIKTGDFYAYRWAAQSEHLPVLQHLEASLSLEEKKAAIKAVNFEAYRTAAATGHINVVKHLLKSPACLSYAERHDYEYGEGHIYGYVSWCIKRLKQQKALFESATPNWVFDIAQDEAIHAFYLLRNLIRRGVDRVYGDVTRGAEALSDEIRFLLSIPAVKALCHQVVTVDEETPGQENELLRLARRIGNEEAAGILLQLRDVRELAESADFYPDALGGGLNLREIARDRESSMVALSESERRFVEKSKSHYDAVIKARGGSSAVFASLKAELKSRYEASPATIELPLLQNEKDDAVFEEIALPFDWEDLQILKTGLTQHQYEAALKAYYEHDVHTAYRYLSKPNKWMHPQASYVYISDDRQDRWSTFEEYQWLIALFYTAAFDERTPAIDGYTLESRKALFIKQLALIGRAHNWDRRDPNGHEHDDKEADKPSCFSGVNRRLFQSVLGHGLFKVVTDTIVIQALNEQIRRYFESVITLQNVDALKAAYEGMIMLEGDMDAHLTCLKRIDISEEKKADMIASVQAQLSDTYKTNFDGHKARFVESMNKYLASGVSGAHFIDFQGPCGLDTLLEQIEKTKHQAEWTIGKWRHSLWLKAQASNKASLDATPNSTRTHHN